LNILLNEKIKEGFGDWGLEIGPNPHSFFNIEKN
jgi:hypothetical protein